MFNRRSKASSKQTHEHAPDYDDRVLDRLAELTRSGELTWRYGFMFEAGIHYANLGVQGEQLIEVTRGTVKFTTHSGIPYVIDAFDTDLIHAIYEQCPTEPIEAKNHPERAEIARVVELVLGELPPDAAHLLD